MAVKEIWVPVENYEGLYEVSNMGRVRNSKTLHIKSTGKDLRGYLMVELSKNNIRKHLYVHKLVKRNFTPKEEWGESINHINEDKTDNRLCNLEYCTMRENILFGTRGKRSGLSRINHPLRSLKVIGINNDGLSKEFVSIAEAARQTRISRPNIVKCLKGYRNHAGNYKWNYKDVKYGCS